MSKREFNKLHFGMGVLLYEKFAACIFSEQIFLSTPLDGASDTGYWAHFLVAFEMESICMSWKLNEAKIFIKVSWHSWKRTVGVEIKCHITYFREQIELWVAPKKEVEKPWVGPNTGYFSSWWPLLGARKLAHKKFKKQFFPNICYIL